MRFLAPVILLLAGFLPNLSAERPLWDSLAPQHRQQLESGQYVELEEEIFGNPWPRFTIYRLVKASPAQVAAVFWDCELDPKYIPNCLKVSILAHPEPNIVEAEYTLSMPLFLPDEVYVSRNEIRRSGPEFQEISWKVLRSRYTKACSGKLLLEEHAGGTLLCYINLVEPSSKIAGLMRRHAGKQVIESVQELVKQVGRELSEASGLLQQQVCTLDQASGKAAK